MTRPRRPTSSAWWRPASRRSARSTSSSTTRATAARPSPCRSTRWRTGSYTINSCLTTSYMCIRFVVPEMIKAGGGAIVNISSGAGRRGLPYRIGYCSAKAGQVGMTYGMALELAPHNIRVNCVAPGAVEGDRIDRVIAGQAEVRGISPRGHAQGDASSARRSSAWPPRTTSSTPPCSSAATWRGTSRARCSGERGRAGGINRADLPERAERALPARFRSPPLAPSAEPTRPQ